MSSETRAKKRDVEERIRRAQNLGSDGREMKNSRDRYALNYNRFSFFFFLARLNTVCVGLDKGEARGESLSGCRDAQTFLNGRILFLGGQWGDLKYRAPLFVSRRFVLDDADPQEHNFTFLRLITYKV
jgi:hypothetical protein